VKWSCWNVLLSVHCRPCGSRGSGPRLPTGGLQVLARKPEGKLWTWNAGMNCYLLNYLLPQVTTLLLLATYRLFSSSCTGFQFANEFSSSSIVLDGRLSTRCRCRSPSTTVIWRCHMFSATDPHVPRRPCVWCCRTTSVERFADQPPSASPLPWTVPTGAENAFIWLWLFIFRHWL